MHFYFVMPDEDLINLLKGEYETNASGKKADLSAFGVDFSKFVKVKISSHCGKAVVSLNGKKVYTISSGIIKAKIIRITFLFEGTGTVDYVALTNGRVNYRDDFNAPKINYLSSKE